MTHLPVTIAVDLDDVLCQTNLAVAEWHNERYGTRMSLQDFHYYHYWKNPLWGTPDETLHKVKEFYATHLTTPTPVLGALEGLQALRRLGYRLEVVTARHTTTMELTRAFLEEHFPGMIEGLTCTGQFQEDIDGKHVKLSKSDVCRRINAKVLIDDSVENTLECASASPPINTILFGDYEWNKRESRIARPEDDMSFEERFRFEQGREWWKDEMVQLPETVVRAKNWAEVVEIIERSGKSLRN